VSTVSGELVSILRYADVAAVLRNPQISVDDRASQLHQGLVAEGRFSPAYLASRAPAVGGSFSDTRTYSDGDASYTMTAVVTRVG